MSGALARTALRLAAIEALNADAVVAAACAGRVYDSLIGAFQSDEPVPVIVVATEDDRGDAYSANNGGPPFDQVVDLTIEITVCSFVAGTGDDIDIFVPATTRESEVLVDMLEFQVVQALTIGDTVQSALVRKVTRRVTAYRSFRYVSEDTGVKLARRLLTLTASLQGDEGAASPFDVPTGPFAALPDPLRTVADSLPAGSSGLATCQALVAKLTPPAVPEPFAGAADATYAIQPLRGDVAPDPGDPNVPTIVQEIDIDA